MTSDFDVTRLSLADFYFSDTDDPLVPTEDFIRWRKATSWASQLYEPQLFGAPVPRVEMIRGGKKQKVINLSSYNYLGLSTHPKVITAAKEALDRYGSGACGSPLLSGLTDLHGELEQQISQFMNRPSTMLFNSGFGGAMGSLAGLLRKGDVAVLDEKCHLSLVGGVHMARAKTQVFKHNDSESLDSVLKKTTGMRRIVVVEGIYSMDGDMADLPALTEVAAKHGCSVFIDEAHSILTQGECGRGTAELMQIEDKIDLVFATFSKSFAALGGFVSGNTNTIEYLRCFSAPYGFSCALPPSVVAGLLQALKLGKNKKLRQKLWDNTIYFKKNLENLSLNLGNSVSQVIPIIIGSNRKLLYELCHDMYNKGLFLAPVDYPSVPEDSLRYRVAISAAHTREDLDEALQIIEDTIVRKTKKH